MVMFKNVESPNTESPGDMLSSHGLPNDLGLRPVAKETYELLARFAKIPIPSLRRFFADCLSFLSAYDQDILRLSQPSPDAAVQLTDMRRESLQTELQRLFKSKGGSSLRLSVLESTEREPLGGALLSVSDNGAVKMLEDVSARCRAARLDPASRLFRRNLSPTKGERLVAAVALAKISALQDLTEHPNAFRFRVLRALLKRVLDNPDQRKIKLAVLNLHACTKVGSFLRLTQGDLPISEDPIIDRYCSAVSPRNEDQEAGADLLRKAYQLAQEAFIQEDVVDVERARIKAQQFYENTEAAYAALIHFQQGAASVSAILLRGSGAEDKLTEWIKGPDAQKPSEAVKSLATETMNLLMAADKLIRVPVMPAIPAEEQLRSDYSVQNMMGFFLSAVARIADECGCDKGSVLAMALAQRVSLALKIDRMNDADKMERIQRGELAFFGTLAEYLGAQSFRAHLGDMYARFTHGISYQETVKSLTEAFGGPKIVERKIAEMENHLLTELPKRLRVNMGPHAPRYSRYRPLKVRVVADIREAHRLARLNPVEGIKQRCDGDIFVVGNTKTPESVLRKLAEVRREWRDELLPKCVEDRWLRERAFKHLDPLAFRNSALHRLEQAMQKSEPGASELIAELGGDTVLGDAENGLLADRLRRDLESLIEKGCLYADDLLEDPISDLEIACRYPKMRELLKEAVADALDHPALIKDYIRFGAVISAELGANLPNLVDHVSRCLGEQGADFRQSEDGPRGRNIYLNGQLVGVQANLLIDLPDGRTVVGEFYLQTVDYPYADEGEPIAKTRNHAFYKIGMGQEMDYRWHGFKRSGDWSADVEAAIESFRDLCHVCVSFRRTSSMLRSRFRSLNGSGHLHMPVVVPREGARYFDVFSALALRCGVEFSEIAKMVVVKNGESRERLIKGLHLEKVEPGDILEYVGEKKKRGLRLPEGGSSLAYRVQQLNDQLSERDFRERAERGKARIEKDFFGISAGKPRPVYDSEIERLGLLMDYGISRFLVSQYGCTAELRGLAKSGRQDIEAEHRNILKSMNRCLVPLYVLAADSESCGRLLPDLKGFIRARYIELDLVLDTDGRTLWINADEKRERMLLPVLREIFEKRKGSTLPNISGVKRTVDNSGRPIGLRVSFDEALSEEDLVSARQLMVRRGGRNLNIAEPRFRLSTDLPNQPGALFEFLDFLEENGFIVDELSVEAGIKGASESAFAICPPEGVIFGKAEELGDFLKTILDERRKQGFELPASIEVKRIPGKETERYPRIVEIQGRKETIHAED